MTDKRMTPQEIVKADCKRYGFDYESVYVTLANRIQEGSLRILRSGNTLLVYSIGTHHEAKVHLMTADNPKQFVAALADFDQAMRAAGFIKATTTTIDPQMLRMLDMAKIQYTTTREPTSYKGKTAALYTITIEV